MHRQPPLVALDGDHVLQALLEVLAVAIGHDPTGRVQDLEVACLARQDAEEPVRLSEQRRQLMAGQWIDRTQAHQRHRQGQPGDIEQQAFEGFGRPGRTTVGFCRWRRAGGWQMHFDDRRHQGLMHFDGRRYQGLQQGRDGRYRRQDRWRRFDHGHSGLRHSYHRCNVRGGALLCIPGLLFEHCGLEFVERSLGFDDFRRCFEFRREFLGDFLQQAVQIRLQRQLRARCDLYRTIH
ncbi:hypothetical protein D3C76_987050 [compost metagenome]